MLIAMIWQCLDFIIYMCVEKMRYPEIHQNNLNQANYTSSLTHIVQIKYNVTINQHIEAIYCGSFE